MLMGTTRLVAQLWRNSGGIVTAGKKCYWPKSAVVAGFHSNLLVKMKRFGYFFNVAMRQLLHNHKPAVVQPGWAFAR
jgi:hypothetical protein